MAKLVERTFDAQLRTEAEYYIKKNGISWYQFAKQCGIDPIQGIYHFRDGGGLNGENSLRVMKFLDLDIDDINV